MKKVYKYPTGVRIPEGAVYLTTLAETKVTTLKGERNNYDKPTISTTKNVLVWHYFLVETETAKTK